MDEVMPIRGFMDGDSSDDEAQREADRFGKG